jgi:pimeloyl-ACP methyl ester carboxylesterase
MGMQVHLRDEGPHNDLTPIVLLHGTASSLHTWDGWAQELALTRRVVRFDLPGFGLTGPTPDGKYSIDRYAQFVIGVLDKLKINRFDIAGNSLGGNIAWYTALRNPERVEKLILVDAGGYRYQSESVPLAFRLSQTPLLRDLAAYILPRNVVASSVKNTYGDPAKVTEKQIDRYYELALREGNRHALSERFMQMPVGQFENLIHELRVPTLILWGSMDRLIPVVYAKHFNEDITGSQLMVFDNLGHIPQEEDPTLTVKYVEAFIR